MKQKVRIMLRFVDAQALATWLISIIHDHSPVEKSVFQDGIYLL